MNEYLLNALVSRFETLETELNTLDAATGDGDHGTTMLKGLQAVANDTGNPAKAFRRAAGGASGSIFSVVVGALDQCEKGQIKLSDALQVAALRITALGQAVAGDKTMLDALLPASEANTARHAAMAARAGAHATQSMSAKRGRAKYVEGNGVGHIDAGARSFAEMLDVFADWQDSSGSENV